MDVLVFAILLAVPALAALAARFLSATPRAALLYPVAGALAFAAVAVAAAARVFASGPLSAAGGWLFLDALSAWHLLVMALVFGLSALFSLSYFKDELEGGLGLRSARQYGGLWSAALAAMALVLVSNNLGVMWIGIEATTLLTAFLISLHVSPTSLEAMWKYLLVCSVGVAFAFVGTLFTGLAATKAAIPGDEALLWTRLALSASALDPASMKVAFVFLVVGYGTKAGLAPMHSWLPDAHSQAPAPVSAIFSGFMLNASLYCVMRYLPLVERATGSSWGRDILVLFGVVSVLVAAAFIVFQKDVKRLLAYSSVEHVGAMTLGLGLGGLGTFAALFHMLGHSLGKSLAFFSAGRVGQQYGTHEIAGLGGSLKGSPAWGVSLFGSLLALIGAAPFAPFMSEFQVFKAAVAGEAWWALGLFLFGLAVAFVGALRHALFMAWGEARTPVAATASSGEYALAFGPLAALLFFGLWMPDTLKAVLGQAAAVVGGVR